MENDSLFQKRLQIVGAVKGIRAQQSQALREIKVPESTVELAKTFTKKAPNACLLGGKNLCLRYTVLYSLPGFQYGVYGLLASDAGDRPVQEADLKFSEWLEAIGNLLRYALNLLLAPRRPEFQTIKVSSVYEERT
jgi:hypothetical protein